jgi:hypothetical protein
MADDITTQIESVVRQMLASPQGLLGRQMYPMLGQGRNQTGRVPSAIVYHDNSNAANSLVAAPPGLSHQSSGSWVAVSYTTADHDSDGMTTAAASSLLTIRTPGVYVAGWGASWAASAGGTLRGFRIKVNSAVIAQYLVPVVGAMDLSGGTRPFRVVTPGDTVSFEAFQNTGGNLSISAGSAYTPYWGVSLVANF